MGPSSARLRFEDTFVIAIESIDERRHQGEQFQLLEPGHPILYGINNELQYVLMFGGRLACDDR